MQTPVTSGTRGWILFDGECSMCRNAVRRFAPLLRRHHFGLAPLQTAWVRERLSLAEEDLLSEMRFLDTHGEVHRGADALIAIAGQVWWARPLSRLARLPPIRAACRKAYRWIARHRHCL
jgi:predicted DCC family thiol-disulfide oxidoreductase YuxK